MKIFVTGGTGYIGEYVIKEGIADGHELFVLTRSKEKYEKLKQLGVQSLIGDFLKDGDWIEKFNEAEAIIHLAAPPTWGKKVTRKVAENYSKGHLALTKRLFELCKNTSFKKIIFVGGTSYFGDTGSRSPKDESYHKKPRGWGPYIAPSIEYAKKMKAQLPITIVYPAQIYGPSSWMEQLYLEPLYSEKPLTSLKGSSPMFSPIHIEDCSRAMYHLITHGEAGEDYILVDNLPIDSFVFREEIERNLGKRAVKLRLVSPFVCNLVMGPILTEYATTHSYFTNEKLVETGFTYRYPTYKEGLPQVVKLWLEKKQR